MDDVFLYVAKNEAMPHLFKVGHSNNPTRRAQELSDIVSVPLPFQIVFTHRTRNPYKDEHKAHKILSNFRIGKEFFKCPEGLIIHVIKNLNRYSVPIERRSCENFFTESSFGYDQDTEINIYKDRIREMDAELQCLRLESDPNVIDQYKSEVEKQMGKIRELEASVRHFREQATKNEERFLEYDVLKGGAFRQLGKSAEIIRYLEEKISSLRRDN